VAEVEKMAVKKATAEEVAEQVLKRSEMEKKMQ
jgi:hypothetical protein